MHGIGNKPPASVLMCQWDSALFNVALGDRSRMAYWVNREFYPTPSEETCASGDLMKMLRHACIRITIAERGAIVEVPQHKWTGTGS